MAFFKQQDIKPTPLKLPVMYDDIPYQDRWIIREEYRRIQDERCFYCQNLLPNGRRSNLIRRSHYKAFVVVSSR